MYPTLAIGVLDGTNTSHRSPACAAYAAIATPAFPLESATTWVAPTSSAAATTIAAPRSLNDAVGDSNSSLAGTARPASVSVTKGVLPSPIVTSGNDEGGGTSVSVNENAPPQPHRQVVASASTTAPHARHVKVARTGCPFGGSATAPAR